MVPGDLNDTPNSDPLKPIIKNTDLHDAPQLQFGKDMSKCWTYHFCDFKQNDYLVVSTPLKSKLLKAGVERRGIHDLEKLTSGSIDVPNEVEYASVTSWSNLALGHGAVWTEFEF